MTVEAILEKNFNSDYDGQMQYIGINVNSTSNMWMVLKCMFCIALINKKAPSKAKT